MRTLERGYTTGRRAGQVCRVHVIREVGPGDYRGKQTMCGQHAWPVTNSEPVIRDAPHPLPDGLSWCPKCIGLAAEELGRLDDVARLIGAAPREATSNGKGGCGPS